MCALLIKLTRPHHIAASVQRITAIITTYMAPVVLSGAERLCGDARSVLASAGSQQCPGLRGRPTASHSTPCASIFDGASVPSWGGRAALRRRSVPSTRSRGAQQSLTDAPSTSTHVQRIRPQCTSKPLNDAHVHTEFIAETLLPTRHGKFRLRGYRHTVCEVDTV